MFFRRLFAIFLGNAARETLANNENGIEPFWKEGDPKLLMALVQKNYLTPDFLSFAGSELKREIDTSLFNFANYQRFDSDLLDDLRALFLLKWMVETGDMETYVADFAYLDSEGDENGKVALEQEFLTSRVSSIILNYVQLLIGELESHYEYFYVPESTYGRCYSDEVVSKEELTDLIITLDLDKAHEIYIAAYPVSHLDDDPSGKEIASEQLTNKFNKLSLERDYKITYIETDDCLTLTDFFLKKGKIDHEYDELTFSIKVDVENNTDDREISFKLQGVDEEGFEVDSFLVDGKVPIGDKVTVTQKMDMVDLSDFKQIVAWNLEPY